jgi:nicotinamidase-related amidase
MEDWRLDRARTSLLVIDVQEKLVPVMTDSEALVRKLVTAILVARQFGLPIHHTEQAPEKLGSTVEPVRQALGPDAPPPRLDLAFSKAGCFRNGDLPANVLVAGIETHVCVRQTVFDLRARGHAVYLLADAISSRAEVDRRLALHELREIGGARITTVETIAWELLGRAEGDEFRRLLKLLK